MPPISLGQQFFLHQEILQITQSLQFQNAVTNMRTKWHFIPPLSPHFGGIWEAGVKSRKHHLRRIIRDSTLTYEEMTTFLYQVVSSSKCNLYKNVPYLKKENEWMNEFI